MNKLFLILLLSISYLSSFGQANNVVAKVVNVTQSLYLRGNRADSLSTDGTFGSNSNNIIPSQRAIATWVTNNFVTPTALRDTAYGVLNQQSMISIIEFIQANGDSVTFTDTALVGRKLIMLDVQNYLVPSSNNGGVYYTFNSSTGQIVLTNGHFTIGDFVHIEYRNTPIFLTDGSGNYVRDSHGNYIITN